MKRLRQRIEILEQKSSPTKEQPWWWEIKKDETRQEALARLFAEYPNPKPVILLPEDSTEEEWVERYGR